LNFEVDKTKIPVRYLFQSSVIFQSMY